MAHTREQLGGTIGALTAKADVTARVKDAAAAVKGQLAQVTGRLLDTAALVGRLVEGKAPDPGTARTNRPALIAAAGVLAAVLLVRRTRRTGGRGERGAGGEGLRGGPAEAARDARDGPVRAGA
ncbi:MULTISPECIES: DUF3618 domain-containing protein [unclassified Streptomyces]|uniref:DUF3618 domain-containing protein n=1 Tax=unclassified Streptomyces TaxID=2593676 RepID=UPI003417842F